MEVKLTIDKVAEIVSEREYRGAYTFRKYSIVKLNVFHDEIYDCLDKDDIIKFPLHGEPTIGTVQCAFRNGLWRTCIIVKIGE